MKIIYLLACTGLLGCWSSSSIIHGPDGKDTIAIRCGGSWADQQTCLEEASKTCPTGYTILDQSANEGTALVANQYGVNTSVYTVRTFRGNMVIRCGPVSLSTEDASSVSMKTLITNKIHEEFMKGCYQHLPQNAPIGLCDCGYGQYLKFYSVEERNSSNLDLNKLEQYKIIVKNKCY